MGMPPNNEFTVTAPLPETELRQLIHEAYGDDESTAMLTQELLVYLSMFIRTEPQLFHEMLRLRVGLIIQVMVSDFVENYVLVIYHSWFSFDDILGERAFQNIRRYFIEFIREFVREFLQIIFFHLVYPFKWTASKPPSTC